MLMPLRQISATIGSVMFPALSRVQEDKVRVKQIYLRTVAVIALITFPMMTGLFVSAENFVLALMGQQWMEVIPILKIFCFIGLIQSIGTTVGWIYISQGRTDWQLRWGIASGALLMAGIVIGISLGTVKWVAMCYAIVAGIILPYPNFAIPGKLINLKFAEVARSVSAVFGCALSMSAAVYYVGKIIPPLWTPSAKLMVQVACGMFLYMVLIQIFKIRAYIELKTLLMDQWENFRLKGLRLEGKNQC